MSTVITPEAASCLDELCKQAFLMLGAMVAEPAGDRLPIASIVACRIYIANDQNERSSLFIHANSFFATSFTRALFSISSVPITDEEIVDAMKELANTIGGNLKGIIEAETTLSIPEAVLHALPTPAADPSATLKYYFENAGECVVELCGPLNNH